MALDFLKKEDRLAVIKQIKSDENRKRKAQSLKQFRCYNDNLDQYVQERLLQQFSSNTVKMMPIQSSINLVKRIINQGSSIYTTKAKREFTELAEESVATVETIYRDASADSKLMKLERIFNLQNQTHIYVKLKNKKLELVPLYLHNIDAIPSDEDPEVAFGYIISNFDKTYIQNAPLDNMSTSPTGYMGSSQSGFLNSNKINELIADQDDYKLKAERYTLWTKELNFVFDGNGDIVGDQNALENEIGEMPIIDVSTTKDFTYFVDQGSGVVEFAIDYNVALSDLMFISRLQGFAQGAVQGDQQVLDRMTTIELGPAHLIKLPNGPDGSTTNLQFVQRGSDIQGAMEAIEMLLSSFLTSKGIDPKTISGKGESLKYASGAERLLAMVERFESSRENYDLFEGIEAKIFQTIKAYLAAYNGQEDILDSKYFVSIPEESKIFVKFGRPELAQSEQEKVAVVKQKLDAGLMSKTEALQELRGVNK
jgi:hypothetical protein